MKRRIGWLWFLLRYKLGLARPGIDFVDVGQDESQGQEVEESSGDAYQV